MKYLDEAKGIYDEIVANRRYLHEHPETGYDLENTVKFVKDKLLSYGYTEDEIQEPCQGCITALIGQGDKTLLIRADMDALPIQEETGLPFASTNGKMHACGHDMHTAILLATAKLLKKDEDQLQGRVKLLFQPAEELLTGGQTVIDAGVLENPKVDAAIALHVNSQGQRGFAVMPGPRLASGNNFRITVKGKGSHGAYPQTGIDPVLIGANIVTGVETLISRELPFDKTAVLTMGRFSAEGAVNIIPNQAVIEGTFRTLYKETQDYLKKRLPEVCEYIAQAYRGEVEFELLSDVPPLTNDEKLYEEMIGYLKAYETEDFIVWPRPASAGSEDFAFIGQQVPVFFFGLHIPDPTSETHYALHNSRVMLDETYMPYGVAAFCDIATGWLKEQSE